VSQEGIVPNPKKRLLDQVREVIQLKHYSIRTEQTYVDWIKRYIFFHGKQHPREMGGPDRFWILDFGFWIEEGTTKHTNDTKRIVKREFMLKDAQEWRRYVFVIFVFFAANSEVCQPQRTQRRVQKNGPIERPGWVRLIFKARVAPAKCLPLCLHGRVYRRSPAHCDNRKRTLARCLGICASTYPIHYGAAHPQYRRMLGAFRSMFWSQIRCKRNFFWSKRSYS